MTPGSCDERKTWPSNGVTVAWLRRIIACTWVFCSVASTSYRMRFQSTDLLAVKKIAEGQKVHVGATSKGGNSFYF